MFGRDEKVSGSRLTAVQYIILVVFWSWPTGCGGAGGAERFLLGAGGKEQDSQGPHSGAPWQDPRSRRARHRGQLSFVYGFAAARFFPRSLGRRGPDRAGAAPDPKEVRDRIHKFAGVPQYQPIYLKEDITPDELAFIESHRNELPELDISWRTGGCTRATGSWRTSWGTWVKSANRC